MGLGQVMHWRQFQELQKVAQLGDRYLSYVDQGYGRPLVLLHGMPTWGFLWHRVLPALAQRRRVLIPDLLGYGYSDKCDRFGRSLERQAAAVASWLEQLGLPDVDVAGHDIGGAVALRLAAFHGPLVGRLCLIDSVCYDSWPLELTLQLGHPGADRKLSAKAAGRLLKLAVGSRFVEPSDETLEGLLAPYATETGKLSLIRNAVSLDTNMTTELTARLSSLRSPVLALWGEADTVQPASLARRLAFDLPRCRVRVVPGAGHYLPLEQPESVADELESFLRTPAHA